MPEDEYDYQDLGPMVIKVNGHSKTVYNVGAYEWIWSKSGKSASKFQKGGILSKDEYDKLFKKKVTHVTSGPHKGWYAIEMKSKYVNKRPTLEEATDLFNREYNTDKLKKGGTTRNISRDRKFKSKQPHEQIYKRKTTPKNPTYKKHKNPLKAAEALFKTRKKK